MDEREIARCEIKARRKRVLEALADTAERMGKTATTAAEMEALAAVALAYDKVEVSRMY